RPRLRGVDRLRLVLDRVADLRAARGHQALTSSPVAYMASIPPAMPPATARSRTRPAASRSPGAIWTITWAIAPTPTPSRKAASDGVKAAAPIHAPNTAGAPAIRAAARRRPTQGRAAA